MSEMTLEQAYEQGWRAAADWADRDDLVYDIGSPAYKKDRQDRIARLTRAPMQVTDDLIDFVAKIIADHLGHGMREKCERTARDIVEPLSARLDQPVVAPDGLTSDVFGDWCNTLTHAYMYVNERSLENAKHGIELVLDDLREWQEKLSQPHPQAAQDESKCRRCGATSKAKAETMCTPDGDSCPGCESPLADRWEDAQGGEVQSEAVAVVSGSDTVLGRESRSLHWLIKDPYSIQPGTKLYTHPPERAAVPENVLDRMCQAFYENKGSMKWEKLMDCWKDNYRSNMRAALSAAPTLAGKEKG